jgi:uncharacterized protein (TIGR00645 family)
MKRLEIVVENVILASRWLLVVFYLGLAVALGVYALSFGLIDAALVASLVVMVIISGYENFVSRFDDHGGEVHWLGTIDAGSLKIKVASTIVAISSIHLLQIFLNHAQYTSEQLMWLTIMHLSFVVSALFLAWIDRISARGKGAAKDDGPSL